MEQRPTRTAAPDPARPACGQQTPTGDGWVAALGAPAFVILALVCCGGPLLLAALLTTGAGVWLAVHGFALGAVALLVVGVLLAWRVRVRMTRGS